jgi:Retrotransposon gag protein
MNPEDRLESLERGQMEQRDATQVLQETMNAILSRLASTEFPPFNHNLHPDVPVDPSLTPTPTPVIPQTPAPRSHIKPGTLPDFDSERSKGRAFLNSCLLYMSLCSTEFADDQAKIHWVLSYMKSGCAATFADRVLRHETRSVTPRFASWVPFRAAFVDSFCPENESTFALMRLESDCYFQSKRSVDAYVDEFEDLIDLSGYSDPLAIVIKFRRGLDPAIQDKIAELGTDRPKDDSPSSWYAAARRFDQNRLANEAFHSSVPKRAAPLSRNIFARTSASAPATLVIPFPAPRPAPRPLPPGIPMDIDAQRAKQLPPTCYRCGETGHLK